MFSLAFSVVSGKACGLPGFFVLKTKFIYFKISTNKAPIEVSLCAGAFAGLPPFCWGLFCWGPFYKYPYRRQACKGVYKINISACQPIFVFAIYTVADLPQRLALRFAHPPAAYY